MQCLYCDKVYSGGVNLTGGDTSISKCDNAPEEVVDKMNSLNKEKTQRGHEKKKRMELDKIMRNTKADMPSTSSANKPVTQTSITADFNASAKATADAAVAKMFFANGISFSIVESKYIKNAFTAVSKCGTGYKLPNCAMLSGKLLQEAVGEADNNLKEFKTQMCVTGATLISDGWTNVQKRPIIGFVLDPEFRLFLQHENEDVMPDFHAVVERTFKEDVQSQVKAMQQHETYIASGHGLFSRPMAEAAAKEMPAFRWWLAFGAHVPELQKIAVRVLSQVTSASASERNWSAFDFIHTKKRNRLHCKRVSWFSFKGTLRRRLSHMFFLCSFKSAYIWYNFTMKMILIHAAVI